MDSEKIQIIIEYLQANPQEIPAVVTQIEKLNTATGDATKKIIVHGEEAEKAGLRIRGLTYYVRGGADAIRYAAAGGGSRAAFYAIDEAIRGMLVSGAALSTLVPILGGIALAAGAGYLVWREYTAGEHAAAKAAEDLQKELKGVDEIMTAIQKRQQAGLLGQATADEFKKYLSGEIPLYKNADGHLSQVQGTHFENTASIQSAAAAGTGMGSLGTSSGVNEVKDRKAKYDEIQKYIQDVLNVQGKLDSQQIDAIIKLRELQKTVHAESLTQLDQEKLAIRNKFEEQQRGIELELAEGRKVMTLRQIADAEAAITQSKANEAREIREKEYAFEKVRLEEIAKIQNLIIDRAATKAKTSSEFAQKTADDELKKKTITAEAWESKSLSILNKQIADEKAAALVRYDSEKDLRAKLIALTSNPAEKQRLRAEGTAQENQYQQKILQIDADAAAKKLKIDQDAAAKIRQNEEMILHTLESENRVLEEQFHAQMKILDAEKQRHDMQTHPSGVNNSGLGAANALGSIFDKTLPAKIKLLQNQMAGLVKEAKSFESEMAKMKAAPPGTFSDADFERVQQQIEANKDKQIQAAQEIKTAEVEINQQRLAGVSGMFGNMAQTAKAFGKEGFAAYKALAIAQATVDTARAAIAAYQSTVGIPYVGPFLAPIAAAAAIAAGAAQIAQIESQSFAEGGVVEGTGTGTSDNISVNASPGEFFIRENVMKQPGALAFMHEFNTRGMDALNIASGSFVSGTGTTARYSGGREAMGAAARASKGKINVGFVNTRNHLRQFMRQEGTSLVLDGFSERGNPVSS